MDPNGREDLENPPAIRLATLTGRCRKVIAFRVLLMSDAMILVKALIDRKGMHYAALFN